MIRQGLILIFLVLLSACSVPEDMVQTAIAETGNASIIESTRVAEANKISREEKTRVYKENLSNIRATGTSRSATLEANATTTSTQKPTNTQIPDAMKTATKVVLTQNAEMRQKTEIASFQEIDWRDLTTYTEKHIGESVHIWGKVFNINNNRELQIWVNNSDEAIYVYSVYAFDNIYEGDIIDVYCIVMEKHCGINALGGQVCLPLVAASIIEKR